MKVGGPMNQYLKALLMSITIIVISVSCYYFIISGYPYDPGDCAEEYFNSVLILKGMIATGAIIAASISSAIIIIEHTRAYNGSKNSHTGTIKI